MPEMNPSTYSSAHKVLETSNPPSDFTKPCLSNSKLFEGSESLDVLKMKIDCDICWPDHVLLVSKEILRFLDPSSLDGDSFKIWMNATIGGINYRTLATFSSTICILDNEWNDIERSFDILAAQKSWSRLWSEGKPRRLECNACEM